MIRKGDETLRQLTEIFEKRLQQFKRERQQVVAKSVPMTENLALIDNMFE